MAAPLDMTTENISGTFVMNKELSDDTDKILERQGVGWFLRTAIRLATITLHVNHYYKDGVEHIDIKQTLTGGIEGTEENRTIDWTERKHTDKLFGPVVSKSRRIKAEDLPNEYLSVGWLSEAVESGLIHSYVVSDKPEGSKGYWTAEQAWGFEIINEQKRHVRHVYFTSEEEIIKAKLIYDYAGPYSKAI
ncbi:hypothetical protein Clacol_008168 [Clathrus columnatus]|uniref:Uncharacterized protein n=1 Tax=Clathrus columnatus TaxID=1419009 RepID=A0AAV5ANB5_9AGAM|nr:hypothetical protein Clacol_008168 [Clathrus columnatus]